MNFKGYGRNYVITFHQDEKSKEQQRLSSLSKGRSINQNQYGILQVLRSGYAEGAWAAGKDITWRL